MKIDGYVMKVGEFFVDLTEPEFRLSPIDFNSVPTLNSDELMAAQKIFSDKAEVFKIELKRVHMGGQSFPDWVVEVDRAFKQLQGTNEIAPIDKLVSAENLRHYFNSGIDAQETARMLSNELYS